MKPKLFKILVILAVISMLAAPVGAMPNHGNPAGPQAQDGSEGDDPTFEPVTDVTAHPIRGTVLGEDKNNSEAGNYIIQLMAPPLASYRGGIDGLEATNPEATGTTKLDAQSEASQDYLDFLSATQAEVVSRMDSVLGRQVDVLFNYQAAYNGLTVTLLPEEAATVAKMPGVRSVQRDFLRFPTTDVGPAWIGAPSIWDGSATGGLPGTMGEGVIIGVIDTGVNLDNPSFADIGDDGYDHTNPFGSGNYVGLCDSDPGTWVCNDKLIGYWIFTGETTEDTDGHGSHTASTAGGNVVFSTTAVMTAPTYVYSADISGVSPHSNIIGYDACLDDGGCPGSALVASIDQTVLDGVDVINYSIGGGSSDPWGDADALAFLAAQDAGIVPVTSAGNDGSDPATIGSPADAPWVLSVGASTHNRKFENAVINMTGGDTTPPADLSGKSITAGLANTSIVYAGDYGDALCLDPFPGGTWSGEIVVCDRGIIARVAKGVNVLAGGAGGLVLANTDSAGESINADPHVLPAVHIGDANGDILRTWLASGSGHMAEIQGTIVDYSASNGDIMAGFSSRGPNPAVPDVIKPDVTAPGVDIFAAYSDPEDFWTISGTSMSSPHTAGAAALLTALHPDWTPSQIKSALMATAKTADVYDDDGVSPADPFDFGGGRVDLSMAGAAGFVLDETSANYTDANPASDGDPTTLNLASLANSQCLSDCSWTRTISSTLDVTVTWTTVITAPAGMNVTVTPSTFDLAPYATQELTVTADVSSLPTGDWVFGSLIISPTVATSLVETSTASISSTPSAPIIDDAYDGSLASMTCDVIDAAGEIPSGATVEDVSLDIGIDHTFVGDLVTKLQSPDSTVFGVFSRPGLDEGVDDGSGCCGDESNLLATSPLNFSDPNPVDAELIGSGVSGGVACQDDGLCDFYPNPDSVAGFTTFAGFVGENASGNWTLCTGDGAGLDLGSLEAWTLTLDYSTPVAAPPAHFPIAVVPTSGVFPNQVDIDTRRDAGSQLIEDLQSIEVTDLTIDMNGMVIGTQVTELLNEDPTRDDPYDNLNDGTTFYVTTSVPADAVRLVAETFDSTAVDMDLYVGMGSTPNELDEVCASTTATAVEYCNISNPSAGTWWVLVQNWDESASPPDTITLSYGVVPGSDLGNMYVEGPSSVPAGDLYDLRMFWDEPALDAGDRGYATFDIGSAPGSPGDIGSISVDLQRHEDDVSKVASTAIADVGETLTYTITVQPNVTPEDLSYVITDTIPTGMTYVTGTATASGGVVSVVGDTLTWTGDMPVPELDYVMTTSDSDPLCDTGFGGYVDLEGFGIFADAGVSGDTVGFTAFSSGDPFSYYGVDYTGMSFADDGFGLFDFGSNYGGTPWVPQTIPDPALSNNVLPVYWYDFQIFYDAALNHGVSLATAGAPGGVAVVEYDDIQLFGGSASVMDMELVVARAVDDTPGFYEVVYAYDNISSTPSDATIGLENAAGDLATAYVNNGDPTGQISDGFMICFDYQAVGANPITISFDATVDNGTEGQVIDNVAYSNTDNPGSMEESTTATVMVSGNFLYLPFVPKND